MDRAAEELGTTTKKDTVRAALQQGAACRLIDRMAANDSGLEDEAPVNSMWADPRGLLAICGIDVDHIADITGRPTEWVVPAGTAG